MLCMRVGTLWTRQEAATKMLPVQLKKQTLYFRSGEVPERSFRGLLQSLYATFAILVGYKRS